MSETNLAKGLLDRLAELDRERAEIIREVKALIGEEMIKAKGAGAMVASAVGGRRKGMSAAGRARVAAAQRKRWAKIKAEKKKAS